MTWKVRIHLRMCHELILSAVLRVKLLLNIAFIWAVCSHSTGISLSFPVQWLETSQRSQCAQPTLNLQHSSLPIRRDEIEFNEDWTSWSPPGWFRTHLAPSPAHFLSLLTHRFVQLAWLRWDSQSLWRNNSETQSSASAVKLMRQRGPWGSWLQSELAM